MSASHSTRAAISPRNDWRELTSRDSDGLAVTLLWSRATDQVKVTVADSRLAPDFELHIAGADALAAFHHPFAFAAPRAGLLEFERESLDLQLQS